MIAVLFIGLQGAGKSSFFQERFFRTHVRINLDMLRTRHRERVLIRACVETKQPFVVDNTNATIADRAKYITAAKAAGFKVVGYYFDVPVKDALRRNQGRSADQRVPIIGVLGTAKRLQRPTLDEGFDALVSVRVDEEGSFIVDVEEELT